MLTPILVAKSFFSPPHPEPSEESRIFRGSRSFTPFRMTEKRLLQEAHGLFPHPRGIVRSFRRRRTARQTIPVSGPRRRCTPARCGWSGESRRSHRDLCHSSSRLSPQAVRVRWFAAAIFRFTSAKMRLPLNPEMVTWSPDLGLLHNLPPVRYRTNPDENHAQRFIRSRIFPSIHRQFAVNH
jgi:hypothetical protein